MFSRNGYALKSRKTPPPAIAATQRDCRPIFNRPDPDPGELPRSQEAAWLLHLRFFEIVSFSRLSKRRTLQAAPGFMTWPVAVSQAAVCRRSQPCGGD